MGLTTSQNFFTGTTLVSAPSDNLYYDTVNDLLLTIPGVGGVTIDAVNNQITISTDPNNTTLNGQEIVIELTIVYDIMCLSCDLPTPTPTITTTQTTTPSPTPTIPIVSPTNTPTNTVTPSVTPTNTVTPTMTKTPNQTPTHTPTPTISYRAHSLVTCSASCGGGICRCVSPTSTITVYTAPNISSVWASGAIIYTNSSLTTLLDNVFSQHNGAMYIFNNGVAYYECNLGSGC
jgi:hypothetical protein